MRRELNHHEAKKTLLLICILVIISFCIGAVSVKLYTKVKKHLVNQAVEWSLIENSNWSDVFQLLEIKSSADGNLQKSYFLASSEKTIPGQHSYLVW